MEAISRKLHNEKAQALFEKNFFSSNDFTLFFPDTFIGETFIGEEAGWWYEYCCQQTNRKPRDAYNRPWTSFEFREQVHKKSARLQVSRCFCDTAWSVSVRWDAPKGLSMPKALSDDFSKLSENPLLIAEWKPSAKFDFEARRGPMEWPFLFCMEELVDVLYAEIFIDPADKKGLIADSDRGLILVTGTTNNGKSEVTRGLAWKYLQR